MLSLTFYDFNITPINLVPPICSFPQQIEPFSILINIFECYTLLFSPSLRKISTLFLSNFGSERNFLLKFTPPSSHVKVYSPLILICTQIKFFELRLTKKIIFNTFYPQHVINLSLMLTKTRFVFELFDSDHASFLLLEL